MVSAQCQIGPWPAMPPAGDPPALHSSVSEMRHPFSWNAAHLHAAGCLVGSPNTSQLPPFWQASPGRPPCCLWSPPASRLPGGAGGEMNGTILGPIYSGLLRQQPPCISMYLLPFSGYQWARGPPPSGGGPHYGTTSGCCCSGVDTAPPITERPEAHAAASCHALVPRRKQGTAGEGPRGTRPLALLLGRPSSAPPKMGSRI